MSLETDSINLSGTITINGGTAVSDDTTVFHKAASSEFSALTNKAIPTVSDIIPIEDAAASNAKKYITAGALPVATTGANGYMSSTDKTKLNAMINEYRVTTGTQSSTSTTYADIAELLVKGLSVGTYSFFFEGVFQSTSIGTGIGFRIGSSGATIDPCIGVWSIEQGAIGIDHMLQYSQYRATTNSTSASVVAANTDYLAMGQGFFVVTVAGDVSIQLRSETGTAVSIRADSHLYIQKVA